MDLQITQHDNSTVIVTLRGRFDAFNAGTVKASWQNNEAIRSVILDLSETTFLDSVALATLVQGLKTTRSRRGDFFILKAGQRTPPKILCYTIGPDVQNKHTVK